MTEIRENINTDAAKIKEAVQLLSRYIRHEDVNIFLQGFVSGVEALQHEFIVREKS